MIIVDLLKHEEECRYCLSFLETLLHNIFVVAAAEDLLGLFVQPPLPKRLYK
jgi:hypothetical protein